MKFLKLFSPVLLSILVFSACSPEDKNNAPANANTTAAPAKAEIPTLEYTVVANMPHDTTAFTEGFLFHGDQLFESTGAPEGSSFKSVFGIVDQKTGKLNVKAELDKEIENPVKKTKEYVFGEGIIFFKNKIYQLTYQNQLGFIYDEKTFKKTGQFNYSNKEGWGLTTDGTYIIMSDGTENLTYFDADFKPVKTIAVKDNGYAQDSINELEFINGYIYANVWMTGNIVKIDPATGNIVARINMTPLYYELKNRNPNTLEMNGIAYNAATDKIYVTGKAWPKIYEVKFAH